MNQSISLGHLSLSFLFYSQPLKGGNKTQKPSSLCKHTIIISSPCQKHLTISWDNVFWLLYLVSKRHCNISPCNGIEKGMEIIHTYGIHTLLSSPIDPTAFGHTLANGLAWVFRCGDTRDLENKPVEKLKPWCHDPNSFSEYVQAIHLSPEIVEALFNVGDFRK